MRRVELKVQLRSHLRDRNSGHRERDRKRRLMEMLLARSDELRLRREQRVVAPPFGNDSLREVSGNAEHARVEVRNRRRPAVAGHVRALRQRHAEMREQPFEYFMRDRRKGSDLRVEHIASQKRQRIAHDQRVAVEHQEVLFSGAAQLREQLKSICRSVARLEARNDADVRIERFECATRARINALDRADGDARLRQLSAEPADRLNETQGLPEVFGRVFGDAADDDFHRRRIIRHS